MKFKIRFADQIVGLFIILAIASLTFIIIMLGRAQRWFAKDTSFKTEFVSASGLGQNMPVLYKGFTIGNVSSFGLNENDQVEVVFLIYEQYRDRVKYGTMVEKMENPLGLGNQFLLHPGNGKDLVEEGGFIPAVGSAMANTFIRQGLADPPRHDDSISVLLSRANSILDSANVLLAGVTEAMIDGSDETVIGQMLGSLNRTLADVESLPDMLNTTVDSVMTMLDETLGAINPVLADLNVITSMAASPDGTIAAVLDSNGDVYQSLAGALVSLSGIIGELEQVAAFVPRQLPQIAGMLTDLHVTLRTAEDVLQALTNNPLLRGGIPERIETQSSGTSPRDIRF